MGKQVQQIEFKSFKAFCANEKLSAEKVAEILGVSKWTVFAWYQGARRPNSSVMNVMQQKMGLTPDMLYEFFIKN